jgi:predicted chitinase
MLKAVYVNATMDHLQVIADYFNEDLEKYKLDTPLRLSHFFAQSSQEAGSRARFEENLDYAPGNVTAKTGLMQWLYFRQHQNEAQLYGRTSAHQANQEAIANRAYQHKNDNGDIASGDGWRFRGRGLKQLTGRGNYRDFRDNYRAYFEESGQDFETNPDIVMRDPKEAVRSAVYYWLKNKLYDMADEGATDAVVRKITIKVNGGETGLQDRKDAFHRLWNAHTFDNIYD